THRGHRAAWAGRICFPRHIIASPIAVVRHATAEKCMSLRNLIREQDVREWFKAQFVAPPLGDHRKLRAPPLTKNSPLVGTAFDYLLRFYIERLNPGAKTREWVAEWAALGETEVGGKRFSFEPMVEDAKRRQQDYLKSGKITDELLSST